MTIVVRSLLFVALVPFVIGAQCTQGGGPNDTPGPQGWSVNQVAAWYTSSQGSRLIPRVWLDALEQADNTAPMLAPENIAHYRFVPNPFASWNGPGC